MKMSQFILFILTLAFCQTVSSQDLIVIGKSGALPEVLALLEKEGNIMDNITNVAARDSARKELLSEYWFYHGIDGRPIDLKGLTNRQTKNGFELLGVEIISETLYQYETTAILILLEKLTIKDKGEIHESLTSTLIVMGIEKGEWKILSEIIGRSPK